MERRRFFQAGLAAAGALGASTLPLAGSGARSLELFPRRRTAAGEIRLSSNENPLGIPDSARRAIVGALDGANRYSSPRGELRERLAAHHGVEPGSIVLGNGSAEVLQMAVQAFETHGTRVVIAEPTYEDVFRYSRPLPIDLVRVPLTADWAHDLDAMRHAAMSGARPVLVYICNPNNPTGSLTSTAAVDAWIEEAPDDVVFLVDEAYIHFVDAPGHDSAIKWIHERPNVVVARTFSKIYGMAGLRIGYGVAHPETARMLDAFSSTVNTNHLAVVAALAAFGDEAYLERSLRTNAESRRLLLDTLDALELEHIPSHTNFVMHRIRGDLGTYRDRMAEAGFRVGRDFPPMLDFNRLSIGLPEEMERFSATLREFRSRGWV